MHMTQPRAFSVLELLVSIGIISLISAVVFFNFPQFNQVVLLNRAARELTLSLREAQARAVAVAPLPDGTFPSNYGVFISGTPTTDGSGQYTLFHDANNNLKYDPPGSGLCEGECVKIITFTRGVQITGFDPAAAGMHVLYYRPDPAVIVSDATGACIAGANGTGNGQHPSCTFGGYGPFKIFIARPEGPDTAETRTIEIWRSGQISIR